MLVETNTRNPYVITFGEVLGRLTPQDNQRLGVPGSLNFYYGGSEANVSASLSILGIQSAHVGVVPENELGTGAIRMLAGYGVGTNYILRQPGRLGLYFLEEGIASRSSKIVYDRFDSSFENLDPGQFNWDEILEGATWFHWSGITPAISAAAAESCLNALIRAKSMGIIVSGDINYRRNLWNYGQKPEQIMPELIASSDVIVGSANDFLNCTGRNYGTDKDYVQTCRKLIHDFPQVKLCAKTTRKVYNTSRNKLGAFLVASDSTVSVPKMDIYPVCDRIGSGDAFMAGLIFGIIRQMEPEPLANFALSAAVLKHTIPGDVNTATYQEVLSLARDENKGKLLR